VDEAKRKQLLEARETRAQARKDAEQAHADLLLELEDRFETQLGPRGNAYEIVNEDNSCGEGPIVVKPADAVAMKLWKSKDGNTPEDALTLVRPCVVYPEAAQFAAMVSGNRSELLWRTLNAIVKLAGGREKVVQGKF